jgi:uncharacterized membrane protein
MNFYFVTTSASELRRSARESLAGKWQGAFIIGIIYVLILSVPEELYNLATGYYERIDELTQSYLSMLVDGASISASDFAGSYSQSGSISMVLTIVLGGPLAFGLTKAALMFFRRQKVENQTLFEGFSFFGKCIILQFLISFFTLLWALLFVVPGVIAYLRYSLAFYYLVENPDISPREALNLSKQAMRGNKAKLFWLELSFIGWYILANVAFSITGLIFDLVGTPVSMANLFSNIILSVFYGLIIVYVKTAIASFYSIVNGLMEGQQLAGPYVGVNPPPAQGGPAVESPSVPTSEGNEQA